jgi:hypothetical protein
VTLNRYIKSLEKAESDALFQNILDFYNETWKNVTKPFKVNEYLKKKLKMSSEKSEADRYISSQPIEYKAEDGTVKYNKRKLTELPNCLANINSGYALEKSCELVFFNYEFMHAKFACESAHEILEDLRKVLDELSSWSYKSETKSNYQQLNIFRKLMSMIASQIEDHPDSFAFQFTSRFLGFYAKKHVKNLIDACDKMSIKHCSFISPYLQQESPGGFLLASVSKSGEPILKTIMNMPFFVTFSLSKLLIYAIIGNPIPQFLIDVKLPTLAKLKELYSMKTKDEDETKFENNKFCLNDEYPKFKCMIFSSIKEFMSQDSNTVRTEMNNPDLIPLLFLIIFKHYFYIITANRQIKFVYFSTSEILDACFWGDKALIVIGKNSLSLKLFLNYEKDPNNHKDFAFSNQIPIRETSNSVYNVFMAGKSTLLLTLLLDNDEMRQFLFEHDPVKIVKDDTDLYESPDDAFGREYKFFSSDSDELNYEEIRTIAFNNSLSVKLIKSIKPNGLKIFKILQLIPSGASRLMFKENKAQYVTYLATDDGSLILLKDGKNKTTLNIYRNLTTQPILEIKLGWDGKTFSLRTKDCFYIVVKDKKSDNGKIKELLTIEIKEKVDLIEPLDESLLIAAKSGIIEMYKYNLNEKKTKLTTIFTINTLSRNITDLIFIGKKITSILKFHLLKLSNLNTLLKRISYFVLQTMAYLMYII